MAEQLGEPRSVNVIMLGAFLKKMGLVSAETYMKSLKQIMGERRKAVMEINKKAFMAGQNLL
jgi:Pyruvate/2-oxoacid:ferredoxin oxidoreductase gamma subunit